MVKKVNLISFWLDQALNDYRSRFQQKQIPKLKRIKFFHSSMIQKSGFTSTVWFWSRAVEDQK